MKLIVNLLFVLSCISSVFSQIDQWENEKIAIREGDNELIIIGPQSIEARNWDKLQHPKFWQEIMRLSPDSVLVNISSTRQIIAKMSQKDWHAQTEAEKELYRDSVRKVYQLSSESRINVTTGKNDFYRFDLVYESLPKGVSVFESYGVDPWYAQSILLIESPGRMQKSISGAYGPFQLMPGVARSMGLVVNKYTDERKDFNRSAYAAAQLLKRICIPSARDIATQAGLIIEENAVWFRLLTMHVYHAGALNVKAVVTAIGKVNSGEELIQKMWITTAASFGNNSQNYSQLALAAHIELREYVEKRCKDVYNCGSVYTN